ncbi:HalOD1 output domain-containing protein [Haloarcula sp. JP-L23]|uniref:HalOD1 output domain-containing protein n=1 Tax=Haloarcula sp. JP-L23 TaxID=2716717 RepID=UPI00140F0C53|nr:hypothetical protein G9465_16965 [Haloarcula sp. JP-L23]
MSQRETRDQHVERTVDDVSSTEQLTQTIVGAVAETTETLPPDVDSLLYDVIEPDALSSVLAASTNGHVAFVYEDCGVSISSDGTVLVVPDPTCVGHAGETLLGVTEPP